MFIEFHVSIIGQMTQYRHFHHVLKRVCMWQNSFYSSKLCVFSQLRTLERNQPQILEDKQELKDFYRGKSPTVQAESKEMRPSAPITNTLFTKQPNSCPRLEGNNKVCEEINFNFIFMHVKLSTDTAVKRLQPWWIYYSGKTPQVSNASTVIYVLVCVSQHLISQVDACSDSPSVI